MDVDGIGKWVTLAAAVIAAGQAGTTWIDGYAKEQVAKEQAKQDLALAAVKERSELSKTYLDVLLQDNTDLGDRVLVFDALSGLEGHPLQAWAKKRAEEAARHQQKVIENNEKLQKVLQAVASIDRDINALVISAERLSAEYVFQYTNGDLATASATRVELESAYRELSGKKAEKSVADLQVTSVKNNAGPGGGTNTATACGPQGVEVSSVITLSKKVVPQILYPYFSADARTRIDEDYIYLQNAFTEFQVSDPRLVAIAIATLVVEAPDFKSREEPEATAKSREGSALLGNVEPGDGLRYRGRGYFMLTGRQNYTSMARRLGLPSLVDIPEDAAKPELAARIALAWIMDRKDSYLSSIETKNFVRAGRLARGGRLPPMQQEEYEAVYNSVLKNLTDTK